ncbi:Fe-S cluster assembly protein SufD [Parathermosynechococcus lividus]
MTITVVANSDQADLPLVPAQNELEHLLALAPAFQEPTLSALRQAAIARLREQHLPTPREEDWRFTDLSRLRSRSFQAPIAPLAPEMVAEVRHLLCERAFATAAQLVLIDGHYCAELSRFSSDRLQKIPPPQAVGSIVTPEVFSDLNAALLAEAIALRVEYPIADPIEIFYVSSRQQQSVVAPRLWVEVAANAEATLIERFMSLTGDQQFTNSVTELQIAANARLNHVRIQHQSPTALHIGYTAIRQDRNSRYRGHAIDLGGSLSRHHWQIQAIAAATTTSLKSLAIGMNDQIVDTHSVVLFQAPHSRSEQVHKCILGDRAHGIFNGKVIVPQQAQLTDASQLNRTLLLSDKARVDTKPQLEIVADNVKCSHGATVSQLAAEDIFYLQSRGLDERQARDLLVKAFALEQLADLHPEPLRQELEEALLAALR